MLPERCSVREDGRACPNPPEFVISVAAKDGEYMVGVTCGRHRHAVSSKLEVLQGDGRIPAGKIGFSALKAVGTDCIKACSDDLIQL